MAELLELILVVEVVVDMVHLLDKVVLVEALDFLQPHLKQEQVILLQ